jgi:5-methyltetrahydropteroyltriglutamate--homocysteine methyltransferase
MGQPRPHHGHDDTSKPQQLASIEVISPLKPRGKDPEEIRDRIFEPARYIPVEQLGTTDDCGSSPRCDDAFITREKAVEDSPRWRRTVMAQDMINGT